MTEKSILVTGCSTGIGYTCAIGMQQRGWRVFASARNDDDLAMLQNLGLEVVRLDYCDAASIADCADEVLDKTDGKLTALFNNGAYGQIGAVEDIATNDLRRQFETNLFGVHDLTCKIIPAMRQNKFGRIVQCSSILGLMALKYRGAYSASKFALEGLSDAMRLELRGSGVDVSLIEPGPIRSHFQQRAIRTLYETVDLENSPHRDIYKQQLKAVKSKIFGLETPEESRKITGKGILPKYRLGPDAVLKKLIHACESKRPRPHYHVTYSTYLGALARRVLPGRLMDVFADRIS